MGQLIEPCLLIGAREYWLCFLSRKEVIFLFDPNDIAVAGFDVGLLVAVAIATSVWLPHQHNLQKYYHQVTTMPFSYWRFAILHQKSGPARNYSLIPIKRHVGRLIEPCLLIGTRENWQCVFCQGRK